LPVIENEPVARGGAEAPASSLRPPSSPSWHAVPAGCRVHSMSPCCVGATCACGPQRTRRWQPPQEPAPLRPARWRRADARATVAMRGRRAPGLGAARTTTTPGRGQSIANGHSGNQPARSAPRSLARGVIPRVTIWTASVRDWSRWPGTTNPLVPEASLRLPTQLPSPGGSRNGRPRCDIDA
jgi:hypothetical protein